MAPGTNLVPIGQVFEVFDGKYNISYYGIKVTDNAFSRGGKLIFRPPNNDGEEEIVLRVATIEIEKKRVNVVKSGHACAIRPTCIPLKGPGINWTVLVNAQHAACATMCVQTFSPRPVLPNAVKELVGKNSMFTK
ncbi:hypothetical protein IID19_05820 [Patescibacteria group bacterium]|nr:hypothetical protein [Patescibacteria group bacterium]